MVSVVCAAMAVRSWRKHLALQAGLFGVLAALWLGHSWLVSESLLDEVHSLSLLMSAQLMLLLWMTADRFHREGDTAAAKRLVTFSVGLFVLSILFEGVIWLWP